MTFQPEIGEKVRVYYNFRLKCLSVQTYQPHRGGWRLYYHVDHLALEKAKFKVSQSGRRRCLQEKRKNVHAYVEGVVAPQRSDGDWMGIRYNPYEWGEFLKDDGVAIYFADYVLFRYSRAFVEV